METTGWSPTTAAERAALHVDMCCAEGGFARILPLGDGRVCWVGPCGEPWRHRPDGYRLMLAEEATRSKAERDARKEADRTTHKSAVAAKRVELAANARKAMLANAEARKADRLRAKEAEKLARRVAREAERQARRLAKAKARLKARAAAKRKRRAKAKRLAEAVPASVKRSLAASETKRALRIMADTARRHGVSVAAMIGSRGSRSVVAARREAMWLIRDLRDERGEPIFTLQRIGRLFRRQASTVHTEIGLHVARSVAPEGVGPATCDQAWRPAA